MNIRRACQDSLRRLRIGHIDLNQCQHSAPATSCAAHGPDCAGAGSSQVVPARRVETIHDELVALIGPGGRVTYAAG